MNLKKPSGLSQGRRGVLPPPPQMDLLGGKVAQQNHKALRSP